MKKIVKFYLEFVGLLLDNYGPQKGARGTRRAIRGEYTRRKFTLFPIALITLPILLLLFLPIFIISDGGMTSFQEKLFGVYMLFLVLLFVSIIVLSIYAAFRSRKK